MMSTEARKQHLTDLEFGDLLAGERPGAAAELHLAACEYCRQELAAVGGSLGSFRQLSTAWAEIEAPRRIPMPSRLSLRLGGRPSWGAGLAATAMAALLAVSMGLPGTAPVSKNVAPPAVAIAPSNTELANDNRLMLSIDEELSAPAQPAVPAAELRAVERRDAQHTGAPVLD